MNDGIKVQLFVWIGRPVVRKRAAVQSVRRSVAFIQIHILIRIITGIFRFYGSDVEYFERERTGVVKRMRDVLAGRLADKISCLDWVLGAIEPEDALAGEDEEKLLLLGMAVVLCAVTSGRNAVYIGIELFTA